MAEEQAPISQPSPTRKPISVILILIIVFGLLALLGMFLFRSGGFQQQTLPTPTPAPTITTTPEETPTPTLSVTPTPINTPTPVVDDIKLIKQAILSKLGLTESQAVVTINQNTGKYAKGGVRETEAVGGGYFLAAKVGDNWLIVYDGQANPTCAQIAAYNFPTDMVPECLDSAGKVVKR